MKLRKCEFCGTEFDAALGQCPLCGKAVQPGRSRAAPSCPRPTSRQADTAENSAKRRAAALRRAEKTEGRNPARGKPVQNPKVDDGHDLRDFGACRSDGGAFAFYQLSWFPKFLSPSEPVSMQEQEAEVQRSSLRRKSPRPPHPPSGSI